MLPDGCVNASAEAQTKITQKGEHAKKQRKGNETQITIDFKDGALIIRKA